MEMNSRSRKKLSGVGLGVLLLVAGCEGDESGGLRGDSEIPLDARGAGDAVRESTVESLAAEYLEQLDALALALAEADNEAGAQALADLSPLAANKIHAIARRLEALPVPGQEVRAVINRKIEVRQEEMEKSLGSWEEFFTRLDPSLRPAVEGAMNEFTIALGEVAAITDEYFSAEKESPPPPEPGAAPGAPLPEAVPFDRADADPGLTPPVPEVAPTTGPDPEEGPAPPPGADPEADRSEDRP